MRIQANPYPAARGAAPQGQKPDPQPPHESFSVARALELPAYAYGGATVVLSGLTAYAEDHPYPGLSTTSAGGLKLNPEWTRNFSSGTLGRQAQTFSAGAAALILGVRGAVEVAQAQDNRALLAGSLDLGMAASSALSIAAPGPAGVASALLLAGRIMA